MAPRVIPERFAAVADRPLKHGAHRSFDDGMCVMEAVAYVAGEPWSDEPTCACPVIGAFMRAWNDGLPDDETRTRLLTPLIPRLVGSKSTKAVAQRRADLALDWLVRVNAPAWLDMSEALKPHASALRDLPALLSKDACAAAQPTLAAAAHDAAAARDAAWDAARDAAWDAAWAAAWDAAWAAAWDAAWDAARAAAWDAARAAARAAARDAARAAAWDAARAAARAAIKNTVGSGAAYADAYAAAKPACVALFAPTLATLERSALELIDQMLAVTPESLR